MKRHRFAFVSLFFPETITNTSEIMFTFIYTKLNTNMYMNVEHDGELYVLKF